MSTDTWTELTEAEETRRLGSLLPGLRLPSQHPRPGMPGIREPAPSITYALPEAWTEDDLDDLHRQVLAAFRACTGPEERLYALDWQHQCFWFRPHSNLERAGDDHQAWPLVLPGSGLWRIPVLPDGDYSIFLAEDFRFGIFGHPWERTWCVFGAELLAALETRRPGIFSLVKRHSGTS